MQCLLLSSLKKIGYRNCVNGIRPDTIEGQIVSDADMCDAIGANGILRTHKYEIKYGKSFFDRTLKPLEDTDTYSEKVADSGVHHMFEKLLKLKDLMLTNSGKEEANKRHNIMVDFLYELFDEEESHEWTNYLNNYLK